VEKPNRDGLRELAAEADVVCYSKTWAEVRYGRPPLNPRSTSGLTDRLVQSHGYSEAQACLRAEAPSRA